MIVLKSIETPSNKTISLSIRRLEMFPLPYERCMGLFFYKFSRV